MTYEEAVATIPLGRYRHFKGNEYEVIGIARHSEDESPMVVYRALYGDGGIWVRPASMWNETVTRGGKTYRRFYRLDRIERVEHYERLFDEAAISLAQAFILAEEFLAGGPGAMVLGDNIFYGNGFRKLLNSAVEDAEKNYRATVFGYYVNDPERFGVVAFDEDGRATSIEEKPAQPKSNYAVTGLYFYPEGVSARANQVKPSKRGELEITTLNEMYLNDGLLDVQLLGRGFAWLDTGTMDSLVEAADFVQMISKRQGITISAPEEIAYINGWITADQLKASAEKYGKSPYGTHLKSVAEGKARY